MRIALCNEVVAALDFPAQARLAARLGYAGLEVAPVTLDAEAPHRLSAARRAELRRIAEGEGARITSLHWLLVPPAGLSITSADPALRARTLAEAVEIVTRIGSPGLKTMLDLSAAGNGEAEPAEALLRRFVPGGWIAHVHLNNRNRRGPGQGADRFAPVLRALREAGYAGFCAVEPFDYHPDGPTAAARAIGYLQGVMESL